jgi:hypothetical protein
MLAHTEHTTVLVIMLSTTTQPGTSLCHFPLHFDRYLFLRYACCVPSTCLQTKVSNPEFLKSVPKHPDDVPPHPRGHAVSSTPITA